MLQKTLSNKFRWWKWLIGIIIFVSIFILPFNIPSRITITAWERMKVVQAYALANYIKEFKAENGRLPVDFDELSEFSGEEKAIKRCLGESRKQKPSQNLLRVFSPEHKPIGKIDVLWETSGPHDTGNTSGMAWAITENGRIIKIDLKTFCTDIEKKENNTP